MGGKTTRALDIQMRNPEKTLYIMLLPETNIKMLIDKHIRGYDYDIVIIDEFLWACEKKLSDVRGLVMNLVNRVKKIILFSTPDKLYDPVEDRDEMRMKFLSGEDVKVVIKTFNPGVFCRAEWYYKQCMPEETFLRQIKGHLYR
jgi:hypothetical protein